MLLLMIDDLRPELAAYGASWVHSPRIDALANRSMLFERAYTAVAVCGPARSAILTGRRPDSAHCWSLSGARGYWRNYLPNAASMPEYFKQHGYTSIGLAKLFHPGPISGGDDQAHSWSPAGLPYWHSKEQTGPPGAAGWWAANYSDFQMQDGVTAMRAASVLRQLRQNASAPFFLGVGFHKPHMPQYCPQKYYDLYPPASQTSLAHNPAPPAGVPPVAVQLSKQFRHWLRIDNATCGGPATTFDAWASPECRVPDSLARTLRRAYRACTSYTDAMVGVVLDALEANGFGNDTVVALVSDHGWHLGDLGEWAKYTVFESATRIPLVISLAGQRLPLRTQALFEANDLYATLADAAGLPVPPLCANSTDAAAYCVEGVSALPLWSAPNRTWKGAAFSQYPRPENGLNPLNSSMNPFANGESVMGYSLRTNRYRYSEWVAFDHDTATPNWSKQYGRELYDHTDAPVPNASFNCENENLLASASTDAEEIASHLSTMLHAGWRAQLPPDQLDA